MTFRRYFEPKRDEIALDRPRKRLKNLRPEFRSYSTRGRKFRKKIAKKLKKLKNKFMALFLGKTG